MTDRELLELAAKAGGPPDLKSDAFGQYRVIGEHEEGTLCVVPWNPLADDGDALRLAVKLGIEVIPDRDVSEAKTAFCIPDQNLVGFNMIEEFGGDEMAATRLAIVRAAAEIGKAMP